MMIDPASCVAWCAALACAAHHRPCLSPAGVSALLRHGADPDEELPLLALPTAERLLELEMDAERTQERPESSPESNPESNPERPGERAESNPYKIQEIVASEVLEAATATAKAQAAEGTAATGRRSSGGEEGGGRESLRHLPPLAAGAGAAAGQRRRLELLREFGGGVLCATPLVLALMLHHDDAGRGRARQLRA